MQNDPTLDGNAAAGLLGEIFALDITLAEVVCDGCGAVGPVGGLRAFGLEMGAVLRCPSCDSVLIRLSRTPGQCWIDMRGTTIMRVRLQG